MKRPTLFVLALAATTLSETVALADGFAIGRFDPSFAGDTFFAAAHPSYDRTPASFALTLDYGYQPLQVEGRTFSGEVSQMLMMHPQGSIGFANRFAVDVLVPVSLYQAGTDYAEQLPAFGAYGEPVVADARLAARARLLGQATDPVSLHAMAQWYVGELAINDADQNVTDETSRLRLGLVGAGTVGAVEWTGTLGHHFRPHREFGAATLGPELYLVGGGAYRFDSASVLAGVETWHTLGYRGSGYRAEVIAEAHYEPLEGLRISMGIGPGFGTKNADDAPSLRGLFRVSYTGYLTKGGDADRDGIADGDDACPREDAWPTPDPERRGCPSPDSDDDGVPDVRDQCVGLPAGNPDKPGCPDQDEDADGVPDSEDVCKNQPVGPFEDPARRGCPSPDKDNDGVLDLNDTCIDEPAGPMEDPDALGCPVRDTDQIGDGATAREQECMHVDPSDPAAPPKCRSDEDEDGVADVVDQCPKEIRQPFPDPERYGCPLPDQDKDFVPDKLDACVTTPGAPHPNPKRSGCPGLVALDGKQLRIHRPIYFETGSAMLERKSNPVLQAVRDALEASPQLSRVAVEGHTDNVGDPGRNLELSQARAQSVVDWLVEHGIESSRLVAKGYGANAPLVSNDTPEGRDENRRVEFTVLETTSQDEPATTPPPRPKQGKPGGSGKQSGKAARPKRNGTKKSRTSPKKSR